MPSHAAHQAAYGALHRLVGADQGGQLMPAEGHAGETGPGASLQKAATRGISTSSQPCIQRAQRAYSPEKAREWQSAPAAMAHTSANVRRMRLSVGSATPAEAAVTSSSQQQALQMRRSWLPHQHRASTQHAAHGGEAPSSGGPCPARTRRQQLMGARMTRQGRQQQAPWPRPGRTHSTASSSRNAHHSHQYPLFHSCILSISRRRTGGRGSDRRRWPGPGPAASKSGHRVSQK